jgi:hypothetical protein
LIVRDIKNTKPTFVLNLVRRPLVKKMAMEADQRESNALLLAAGKGLKTAKQQAFKTAEVVAEKTYIYTDKAKQIAEKHIEIALTHWRERMGSNWQPALSWTRGGGGGEGGSAATTPSSTGQRILYSIYVISNI